MEFVPARWFGRGPRREQIRFVVVHSMESPEMGDTAESCARYFATTSRPASAHVCVDTNSRVRCVRDSDIAYAAPGANADGLHLELAGRAAQSRDEWLDDYGQGLLDQAAQQVAEWVTAYNLPVILLDAQAVRAGAAGITTHVAITDAYHRSTHTDPGVGFPMDVLLERVRNVLMPPVHLPEVPQEDDMTAARIVGFTEYGNRWLVGAGPALNLSGPLAASYKADGVTEVVGPRHDQMLKGLLEQSGLTEADLVGA